MREARTNKFLGGFSMKRLSRILPFLVAAIILVGVALYAQSQDGTIAGRVIGRDGMPLQGAVIWVDSLITNNGRIQLRERLTAKTGKDGRYGLTGLYIGRVRVSVVENNQAVMVKGEAIGDELFLASGVDTTANFDLTKAPPPAAVAAAGNNAAAPKNEKELADLRKKLEEEAAASGVMNKAFEEGKAAFNAKNYDEAITKFKAAIEKIPNPPPAGVADVIWANLAKTYDANKNYEESAAAYKKAIEYKPTESNYYLNLSLEQIAMGKLEDSQASIQKAAELNPGNAGMAYYNLGATLINRNQPAEAINFLKKAIELDPKYANAYYQLGLTMIGTGDMAGAQGYLKKYLELAPTGADAETAKALIEATKGQGTTTFQTPEPAKTENTKTKATGKTKGN
jgi:tetratricopeptide (TPR) repeat protein